MIWSWFRRRPLVADLGFVALLVALTVAAAGRHHHTTAGVVLGVVETPPLLWRRSRPLFVLAVVTALSLAMIAAGVWLLPFQLAVALYALASASGDARARLAGTAAIGATAV
ncbi:MAG TPA: hypothetical protein VNH40_14810, partial [Gaiellaceae bacterium]|nr:hypothetical protein [Gaiellaceae bacterium]